LGQIVKLTHQLTEVRGLRDPKKSDHESIASFENSFLDWDEYCEDFGYPIYDKIDVDWYSLVIYYFYFDNDSINDDIIDNVLVNNFKGWMQRKHITCSTKKNYWFKLCWYFLLQVFYYKKDKCIQMLCEYNTYSWSMVDVYNLLL